MSQELGAHMSKLSAINTPIKMELLLGCCPNTIVWFSSFGEWRWDIFITMNQFLFSVLFGLGEVQNATFSACKELLFSG